MQLYLGENIFEIFTKNAFKNNNKGLKKKVVEMAKRHGFEVNNRGRWVMTQFANVVEDDVIAIGNRYMKFANSYYFYIEGSKGKYKYEYDNWSKAKLHCADYDMIELRDVTDDFFSDYQKIISRKIKEMQLAMMSVNASEEKLQTEEDAYLDEKFGE